LTATVSAGTEIDYTWAFGDGESGSGAVVDHTYPAVGSYDAVLTATNSVSELTARTEVTIQPVAIEGLMAANSSPTTLGSITMFTATVGAGTHVSYTWAFGDGGYGSDAVVDHTYAAVGMYDVVVTATNSVSELTATTQVTIQPVAIEGLMAANSSPTTLGSTTMLTATVSAGSNISYTWAFGDGGYGSDAVVSHTYPAAGTYDAVITATNSVSQLTATTQVTITRQDVYIYLPLVLKSHAP
jgi:PKD repeat protein